MVKLWSKVKKTPMVTTKKYLEMKFLGFFNTYKFIIISKVSRTSVGTSVYSLTLSTDTMYVSSSHDDLTVNTIWILT